MEIEFSNLKWYKEGIEDDMHYTNLCKNTLTCPYRLLFEKSRSASKKLKLIRTLHFIMEESIIRSDRLKMKLANSVYIKKAIGKYEDEFYGTNFRKILLDLETKESNLVGGSLFRDFYVINTFYVLNKNQIFTENDNQFEDLINDIKVLSFQTDINEKKRHFRDTCKNSSFCKCEDINNRINDTSTFLQIG